MKLDVCTKLFFASGLTMFAVIAQKPVVLGKVLTLNILLLALLKVSWSGPNRWLLKHKNQEI